MMITLPSIVAQSEGLLVIDKPAGMNVERWPGFPSVEDWAGQYLSGTRKRPFVGIIHRLDRPVSGLLLLATSKRSLIDYNALFREKRVQKQYLALTSAVPEGQGVLEHWLRKDQLLKRAVIVKNAAEARRSGASLVRLRYELIGQQEAGFLLKINPEGGKYHQIRAQLAAAAAPILGDQLYGSQRPFQPEAIALHASQLDFEGGAGWPPFSYQSTPLWNSLQIDPFQHS